MGGLLGIMFLIMDKYVLKVYNEIIFNEPPCSKFTPSEPLLETKRHFLVRLISLSSCWAWNFMGLNKAIWPTAQIRLTHF